MHIAEKQDHSAHFERFLSELEASASNHSTVNEFVNFIDNLNKKLEKLKKRNSNDNEVNVMSIHKSKGLEFPVVFIIGASESILPHSSALDAESKKDFVNNKDTTKKTNAPIEEERRLMYVAITRAEQELFLSSPIKYRGKNVNISRFLMEPFTQPVKQKTEQLRRPIAVSQTLAPTNFSKNGISIVKSRTTPLERALVWSCVNDQCNVWKRITTYEETLLDNRPCPVCSNAMVQCEKEF